MNRFDNTRFAIARLAITRLVIVAALAAASAIVSNARAEDRTVDAFGNNLLQSAQGAAGTELLRLSSSDYADGTGNAILSDAQRANARDLSNALSTQPASTPNSRGLSDYLWVWGQFLDHDLSLTTASAGAGVNGTASISVNNPFDPLGPQPIPFTRSNYHMDGSRQMENEVTSYIDASNVYGSNSTRAAMLRTDEGLGAKLVTSTGNLLMINTVDMPNDNIGIAPDDELFLAGDVRANENVLLTSLHTVFVREHNRLIDAIAVQQPSLDAEQQYQLARKIVGAEMQAITYNEFLPALLGGAAPASTDYLYNDSIDATVSQEFAHAAYRFGHSALNGNLQLASDSGASLGSVALRNAYFNPAILADNPLLLDQFVKGAAGQLAQEIDTLVIDDVRNFLFGPPGAGGLDLAALNIQRGRDHGLPDYNSLRDAFGLDAYASFSQITSDPALQQALETLYGGDIDNVDAWIGMLAEDHLADSSVGELINAVLSDQFTRSRDGDRLFYLSDDAGLYANGELLPEIASLVNLDSLRLSDVLLWNTTLTNLQANVFYAAPEPSALALLAAACVLLLGKRHRECSTRRQV